MTRTPPIVFTDHHGISRTQPMTTGVEDSRLIGNALPELVALRQGLEANTIYIRCHPRL